MTNEPIEGFSYRDALILYCIHSRHKGVSIADILGCEDMIDRSYSTWEELDLTLRRFIALGYIMQQGKLFLLTGVFKERYKEVLSRRSESVYDAIKQLQQEITSEIDKQSLSEIVLPGQLLDKDIYQQALQKRLRFIRLLPH